MTDKILRAKLIRLAHQKPELRAEILPLLATLKTAGRYGDWGFEANEFAETLSDLSEVPRISDVKMNAKALRLVAMRLETLSRRLDKVSQEDWESAMFAYFLQAKKLFMK